VTKIKGIPIDENGAIAFEPRRDLEGELKASEAVLKQHREAFDQIVRMLQINPFTLPIDIPYALERKLMDYETRINDLRLSLEGKSKG
jgi:hypothetical protein